MIDLFSLVIFGLCNAALDVCFWFFLLSKLFLIILVWNTLWRGLLFRTYYYYCYCFLVTRLYHTLVFVIVVPLIIKSPVVGFLYFCHRFFYGGERDPTFLYVRQQVNKGGPRCEFYYGELPPWYLLLLHLPCFNVPFLHLKGLKSNVETQHRPSRAQA